MNVKFIIQHITSACVFLVGIVFGILNICGVELLVNEASINSIVFGLGSLIAVLIELIPFIIKMIKDKRYLELMAIVNDVVYAVEELECLTGPEKKERAISSIKEICAERGIIFNAEEISCMIESVIHIYNKVVKSSC